MNELKTPDLKQSLKPRLENLYQELGAKERVRELLARFYEKMSHDILVGYFFFQKDLNHIIDRQTQFLLRAMGATKIYTGKGPGVAHVDLPPIYAGHFDRRLVLLRETLREAGVSPEGIEAWIEFESQFRNVLVKEEPLQPLKA